MDSPNTTDRERRRRCRLVLFPFPFQGHITPMIQLANILHSKGFDISVIHTGCNFPNPSKYPHFTFHLISEELPENQASPPDDVILLIKLLNSNFVEPFCQRLAQLVSEDEDYFVPCLVTDAAWYFTQAVADKFKLPRIVLRTSSVCSFLAFCAFPLLRDRGYINNMDTKNEDAILELPPLKVKDIPVVETDNHDEMFRVAADCMVGETKKASCVIFNTFKELEEPELAKLHHHFHMPVFTIGPFHKCFSAASSSLLTQDRSSISWLDTQAPKSVLYVSFGSIAAMDGRKLLEVAWGLANSMQPFLWAVRPGLIHGSEWLEMLPSEFLNSVGGRSYIVKWAPQQEVLSHPAVGGFWTHSGWNSTLESICEGVPMICSPFFGDQNVISRYVSDTWRIGIKLEEGLQRGEIEGAIRKLMVGREAEERRQRVVCLKEKADLCLLPSGSSYQELDGLIHFISSFQSSA